MSEYAYFKRGYVVRVVAPGDEHMGRLGRIASSYNDGGDMVHVVAFDGGTTGEYLTDELADTRNTQW